MICSASDFSSSGLSGDESSGTSSPFTRIVAGRPTLSSRSDALRWTMLVMAALKLNVACPAWGASGMWVHSEEELSELDGLGVLHEHLPHHARDFGLDFVHDLHRFDDADDLARRDAAPGLDVGLGAGLRGRVVRPYHGRLDLHQMRRSRRHGRRARGAGGCHRPGCVRLRQDHVLAALVGRVPGLAHSDRRPGPEQTPADLDRPQLGRIPQDLHQLGDDVEVHGSQSYTSSNRSVRPSLKSAGPAVARCTSSSILTPPSPGRYTPGSMVTTAPAGRGSALVFESRGASCTSNPSPCPSEWPNASPNPRAVIGSRASASASRPVMPARTPPRARCCASQTNRYSTRWRSVARAPTTTVRVMSAQ